MYVFSQGSAYSRLSYPLKPGSESPLERRWGTPTLTVLALVWPSWKTVSIVFIPNVDIKRWFTKYTFDTSLPWPDSQILSKCLHSRFPRLESLSFFPLSVCTLSHQGSSNKITPWEVSYSYSNPSIYLPLFSSYLAIINPPLSQDDSLLSCPGVHLTKDPGYRSYPSR